MKQVLVLAAHPDDEILECGGTVARLVKSGEYQVDAVIVCEGESLRYQGMNVDQASATKKAAEILGYHSVRCLGFPDQHLDTYSLVDVNQKIEAICDELRPEIVFTHWRGDLNRDHRIVSEAATVALRPVAEYIKQIYMFCNPAAQLPVYEPFKPNVFVDIEETLEIKKRAFACYASELRQFPHTRSPEAIEAIARSAGVQCHKKAAEFFYLFRSVI